MCPNARALPFGLLKSYDNQFAFGYGLSNQYPGAQLPTTVAGTKSLIGPLLSPKATDQLGSNEPTGKVELVPIAAEFNSKGLKFWAVNETIII